MRATRLGLTILIALVLGLHGLAAQSAPSDALDRALRDELKRSMEQLKLEQLDKPYFIAYRVTETRSLGAMGRYGSLAGSNEERGRVLSVEVRIGDYAFDNSGFFVMPSMRDFGSFGGTVLPLDDDYSVFRRKIWLATDNAYKRAIETIAAKRSARLNRRNTDSLPDFLKAPATKTVDEDPLRPVSLTDLQALVRELSGVRELKMIPASSASATVLETRERYVTSEGTSYSRTRPLLTVTMDATAQATDGAEIHSTALILSSGYDPATTRAQLVERMRSLALGLDSLRAAPVVERYSGPVLFEGHAAAQLFADVLAPALIGSHPMQSAMPGFSDVMNGPMGRGGEASFADKLGARVLPEWMSVSDDPTIVAYENQPLLGHYKVDDEGVASRAKPVIVEGYLKTLLTTRAPVEGVDGSTGNARGGGAAPSTLIVRADSGVSEAALRKRLLALLQRRKLPYGIIVRELQGGGPGAMAQAMFAGDMENFITRASGRGSNAALLEAYRVYPDGREERIRGAQLANFTIESFRDVDAASSSQTVLHAFAGRGGMMAALAMGAAGVSTPAPSSYVVPSLLFDDVSLSRQRGELTTPPLSEPPPGS
jgi:hypothetical protein